MTGSGWEYAAIFAGSGLLSFLLTPLFLRLAVSRGFLDHPGAHKGHESPVPYLGGLAIVTALSLAVVAATLLRPPPSKVDELIIVLAIALGLSVIGLADDLRGLGAAIRLLAEIGAGLGVWALGVGVEFTGSSVTNLIVTVLWVVGITNAFNLLDNADGLSAGVAAISAGAFFVVANADAQVLVAGLALALAGCAIGFLRHNYHPARIYMGDAGSLYLGFLLAYLGLKVRYPLPNNIAFLVPLVVLTVPILDTSLVTISRVLRRQSPFRGGRDHISHRLMRLGFPVRWAVGSMYLAVASCGLIALVISRVDQTSAYLLGGLVGVLAVIAGLALGRVPVYEPASRPT
jgi:UDP-GlcNAc:undecaprenyl-phosphate/decaprenyl-phosphate GlcNAc-1-phosphate transferase